MTHYTKDYSALKGKAKQKAALDDIRKHIGVARFNDISRLWKDADRKFFIQSVGMLLGISGVPAREWADWLELKHTGPVELEDLIEVLEVTA